MKGEMKEIVKVDWVDSYGNPHGWERLETIREPQPTEICQSVGWLLCRNKERITIVPHRSGETFGRGDITIPMSAVRKIRRLR